MYGVHDDCWCIWGGSINIIFDPGGPEEDFCYEEGKNMV